MPRSFSHTHGTAVGVTVGIGDALYSHVFYCQGPQNLSH